MASKKASSKKKTSSGDAIRISMYDVGFGDCFLVRIPTSQGERRILFDCGSVAKSLDKKSGDMDAVVGRLITDVTEDGTARIDVVVCTHRHRDHIAGFSREDWKDVEVGEVWMPWTESDEPEAIRIREAQMRLALALDADFARRAQLAASPAERTRIAAAREIALNATGNEKAMEMLHEGFRGGTDIPRRFLPEVDDDGNVLDTLRTDRLPGVTIHILGPSRDEDVIRDMDPPPGKSYMQLNASADGSSEAPDPFSNAWWLEYEPFVVSPADKKRIKEYSDGFPSAVAAALDSAVNGTSLMILLQFRDALLLFPGDAQWGTWDAALENKKFRRLMERVTFYKVGHHGSHNATPIDFVEKTIGDDVVSMTSTRPMTNWPHIPMPGLITNLSARGPLIRSDQTAGAAKTFTVRPGVVDTDIAV